MTINIGGVVAIVIFYLLILVVGIWAAKKKPEGEDDADDVMLAGRSIGVFVGIFTMTGGWLCAQLVSFVFCLSCFVVFWGVIFALVSFRLFFVFVLFCGFGGGYFWFSLV